MDCRQRTRIHGHGRCVTLKQRGAEQGDHDSMNLEYTACFLPYPRMSELQDSDMVAQLKFDSDLANYRCEKSHVFSIFVP